jgi:release factor glutamine methyltransferase
MDWGDLNNTTIPRLLIEATGLLKAAAKESPGLDAALLLAHVLGVERSRLYLLDDPLSPDVVEAYKKLINRRIRGEPIAYITGHKEFRNLDFYVSPEVLIPRPETEILVEAALELAGQRVLDLCSGSGAVAIALKHEAPGLEIWAVDISKASLDLAKKNAARLLPNAEHITFIETDIYTPADTAERLPCFDLIVSNPPYVASADIGRLSPEVQNEPRIALDGGIDGLDLIKRIVCEAPNHLSSGGFLILEADPNQMEAIKSLLETTGFSRIRIIKDLSGQDRIITSQYNHSLLL